MTRNKPPLIVWRPTRIRRMLRLDFRLSTLFVVAWVVAGQSCRSPQENTQNLTPATVTADATKTETERKADERRKNLEPRPAPQTGSHL